MLIVLALANLSSPLFWAVLIGWILSVVIHEFAHGLAGHFGGDYTVRERGGLSLNPLQYVDPMMTLILPAIFLLMGGVPLPGGATYIRMDLIRSRWWQTAVALAGPLSNLLLFLALAIVVHPKVGWVDYSLSVSEWSPAQQVVAALAFVQIFAVFLNLIPVPPLDGFNAIRPHLQLATQEKFSAPGATLFGLFIVFMLFRVSPVADAFFKLIAGVFKLIGYDEWATRSVGSAFFQIIRGS